MSGPARGQEDRPLSRERAEALKGTLKGWRDSLINLTARNPLIKFSTSDKARVDVALPDAQDLLAGLRAGQEYTVKTLPSREGPYLDVSDVAKVHPDVRARADSTLVTFGDETVVKGALRNLLKRTTQEYMDRGVWILYLAVGFLDWVDVDKQKMRSPLLLVPVRLSASSSKQTPTLGPADEDPVINPALALKLADLDVTLPALDAELADLNITDLLARVTDAVAEHPDWKVTERVTLSYFSFAKEAMYRDLRDNEALVLGSPLVQALGGKAGESGEDFLFDEITDDTVDSAAPPETTPLVRDADSSQRACIAAAVAGRSFTMDGPPGTGKSQTIANMIGAAMQAGRTVLFVSEKAAALDVVRNRLADIGLGAYLLELHSHKATRKEVAAALGEALIRVPVAPAGLPAMERAKVKARREQLNDYADAINRIRNPLGLSLHHVLGQISHLDAVPAAPKTGVAPVDLTVEHFSHIRETANALARAWVPAEQGTSFVWRDVTEAGSMDARLYSAHAALDRLRGLTAANQVVADAFDLTKTTDGSIFVYVVDTLIARPEGLPDFWLTADTLTDIDAAVIRLGADLDRIRTIQRAATAALPTTETGPRRLTWQAIPAAAALPAVTKVEALTPAAVRFDPATAEELTSLAEAFIADSRMLDIRLDGLDGLASLLGLAAPATFTAADDLLTVAGVADAEHRPLRSWLSRDGIARARSALSSLRTAHDTLNAARDAAAPYFTDAALTDTHLPAIAHRFAEEHHGIAKWGGQYRTDKKAVAAFTRDDVDMRNAHEHVSKAAAWKAADDALVAAQEAHASVLGSYYTSGHTDWAAAETAWNGAQTALAHAGDTDLSRAADFISAEATPAEDTCDLVRETHADLTRFTRGLAPAPRLAARPDLRDGTLAAAATWLSAHVTPLRTTAAYTAAVSTPLHADLTYADAQAHVTRRQILDTALADLAQAEPGYRDTFGGLYDGLITNLDGVKVAVAWARTARTLLSEDDNPLTPEQAKAALQVVPTGGLADAVAAWDEAVNLLTGAFAPTRRTELSEELADYDDAAGLLDDLTDDAGGKEEWFAYTAARRTLTTYGLDVAVEFCRTERVPARQVPKVIERALLVEWADSHFATDPALRTVRAEDRDALVAEYQQLDRALISAATSDIIRAVNSRRPRTDVGEATIIANEASKRSRHMPVRTLVEKTRHVTQAIKPVFMMSPLAVSQYLPPDMTFDLVIFDEASQVTPADAINCVYRGKALITAGDQKQLPPTNFFAAVNANIEGEWTEDEDAQFDSILDQMKGSGAFQSLTLRWHYRSRHENLIAFSNRQFYGGHLITFPGAQESGEDVGVELFQVDGVYRRGTTADNPIEADKVAERIAHHYDTRPNLSLGVVTFSEAQATAVDAAFERLLDDQPDLRRHLTGGSRLDRFFVKALEHVQGDERDVMIFSVGYGPDETGKFTMNFGPVTNAGGWRRLNVAVTRARFRNEVMCSFPASRIEENIRNENIRHLRTYLDYAARGTAALHLDATGSLGGPDSPFEESVIGVLRRWGYDVVPQVGAAGYRIDMAVRHPDYPGAFAIGIECDGYTYHSSKAARDRDRLREEVLTGLGWHLHRIWSTAWFRARQTEEERLRAAVEEACSRPPVGLLGVPAPLFDRPVVETTEVELPNVPDWALPYWRAEVTPLDVFFDPADPSSRHAMTAGIVEVVAIEGPVHVEVLTQRLKEAWSIGRVTARTRTNIRAAISAAGVLVDGDFLSVPGTAVAVRTPHDGVDRPVAHVADAELAAALQGFVRDAHGVSADDLLTATSRLFGWGRRTQDMTSRLERVLQGLVDGGHVTGSRNGLTMPAKE